MEEEEKGGIEVEEKEWLMTQLGAVKPSPQCSWTDQSSSLSSSSVVQLGKMESSVSSFGSSSGIAESLQGEESRAVCYAGAG